MTTALIGLGSNLGDRRATLDFAVQRLRETNGIGQVFVSTYYETKSIGGPEGQPSFLNAAARIQTSLSAEALYINVLREIEKDAGRTRETHWGSRTLDLDLLLFGTKSIRRPDLIVPHRFLPFRRFVLEPAVEIAGEMWIPGYRLRNPTIEKAYRHLCDAPNCFDIWIPMIYLVDRIQTELSRVIDPNFAELRFWKGESVEEWNKHPPCKANFLGYWIMPSLMKLDTSPRNRVLLKRLHSHSPNLVRIPTFEMIFEKESDINRAVQEMASIIQSMR